MVVVMVVVVVVVIIVILIILIYLSTAIGLTPGGSTYLHINNT
jgi:hypothetical protein